MDLTQFKNQHEIIDIIQFDSVIHRFKKPHQKAKASWYIGFEHFDKGNNYKTLVVGDYTQGDERHTWKSYSEDEVKFDIQAKIAEVQQAEAENKTKLQAKAADNAKNLLLKSSQIFEDSPYFKRKLITSRLGTFRYKDRTLVPMQNPEGKVTSIQSIFDNGDKRFMKGGQIKGSFHLIGEPTELVYICEGFATGASIHYATGKQVAVCFMASNLESVALHFKDTHKVVVCADNDQFNEANVGMKAASNIYEKHDISFVYPVFKNDESKPTDFNDLHVLQGLEAVKTQIKSKDKKPCEFLGYSEEGYIFYSDRSKMIKSFSPSSIRQGNLLEMASEVYWAANYTAKKSAPNRCNWVDSCGSIIEHQQKAGKFKPDSVKGFGSWIDGKKHVVHTGNKLIVDNKPVEISDFKGKYFYFPAEEIKLNWDKTEFEFYDLIESSRLIDFRTEADRISFIGFIAQSAVFTTQRWRSNIWLNAPKGSGKSVLLEFLSELCVNALFVQDTTVAGIRQAAQYNSSTVLYDEAEGEQSRIKQVLEMARTCSSSGNSKILRGTPGGKSITHSNDFLFCFASIRQPEFTTADQSRITTVRLKGNEDNDKSTARVRAESIEIGKKRSIAMHKAEKLGKDVFLFMNQNYRRYKDARIEAIEYCINLGMTKRQADQASNLIVGYALLANEDYKAVAQSFYNSSEEEIKSEETDTEALIDTLKDTMVRFDNEETPLRILMMMTRSYKQESFGLNYNAEKERLRHAKNVLENYGIYYLPRKNSFAFRKNIELKRVFAQKTNYKDINQALKNLGCSENKPFKTGNKMFRGIVIREKELDI